MPPKDWRAGCGCISILCVLCSLYQSGSAEDQMAGVGSGGKKRFGHLKPTGMESTNIVCKLDQLAA